MQICTRRQLGSTDVETLLGQGYLVIPSKVRRRIMPALIDEYRRLTEHPQFKEVFLMDDPRYIGEDSEGPDIGYMPRDPSKKDKKFITHVTPQLIGEVNARGFDWACCPNLISAITQIQAEALVVASDVVRALQTHCFPDEKFYYGQTLEELFKAGQNATVTRLLNYLPESHKQPKGTAAPHWDRNLLTVHFGSSHDGFYMMRDGRITFLNDRDPENIIVFLGTKLWWMTNQDGRYAGLAHGVVEKDCQERSIESRVAAITFNHQWLPPEERKRMCGFLDVQRGKLAEEFFEIRKRESVPAAEPVSEPMVVAA